MNALYNNCHASLIFMCFLPNLFHLEQDALLEYRMEAPYIPEEKDPDEIGSSDMDGDVEGFASDFL